MTAKENEVVRRAKEIYEQRLRAKLEVSHRDQFVSFEPESGDYFLGRTLEEAIGHARRAYPERITHTCRVGHSVAVLSPTLEVGSARSTLAYHCHARD